MRCATFAGRGGSATRTHCARPRSRGLDPRELTMQTAAHRVARLPATIWQVMAEQSVIMQVNPMAYSCALTHSVPAATLS